MPSPPSTGDRLRCRVNSDAEELQLLHEVYGWIPGRDNVRPKPEVRAQKELLLANLEAMWASPLDWVFHHVFGAATTRGTDGKRSATRPQPGLTVFKPNPFPYDVPRGTEHWVFWMASPEAEWPEERISTCISQAVDARGGGDYGACERLPKRRKQVAPKPPSARLSHALCVRACAVWYPNPKMSVPDPNLFHVQVFWLPDKPVVSAT